MYSQVNEKHLTDRLSVADILSSMANGADESSSVTIMEDTVLLIALSPENIKKYTLDLLKTLICSNPEDGQNMAETGTVEDMQYFFRYKCSSIDGLTCGIPTRTTPTLTPTTLKNIEESFMELSSIPPAPLEHTHQAGFAPPVVSFPCLPKQEDSRWVDDCMHSSDRSLDSPRPSSESSVTSRPSKTGRSGGRRPLKDEKLSPEEEERRRIRRERNKLAAARCRRRRMELTSNLMNEIDGLDGKWHNLQTEIQQLQAQKEQLEFVLEAHKATCVLSSNQQHTKTETEGLEEKRHNLQTEIQHLQAQKEQLEFILEAHKATCKLASNQQHAHTSKLKSSEDRIINRLKYTRPNSLSLSSNFNSDNPLKSSSLSAINEINSSLNTPSAGLFQFDSVMDENGPTTTSSNICVISSVTSCGGQQRSSSSDLSSPDSIQPPKLVSL